MINEPKITCGPIQLLASTWCVRCFDQKSEKEPADFIYNGYSVCGLCLKEIKARELKQRSWRPWAMNLKNKK